MGWSDQSVPVLCTWRKVVWYCYRLVHCFYRSSLHGGVRARSEQTMLLRVSDDKVSLSPCFALMRHGSSHAATSTCRRLQPTMGGGGICTYVLCP